MRVLITRPEREATALAQALGARGHSPVIAPLFRLQVLHPPDDFAASLADSQAVLITSANGARALAEASEQRSKPIFAVGDTTAATAEGLGFGIVTSASGDAASLSDLVRQRLDPANGPLLHVSGADVVGELAPEGFETRRIVLYEARETDALPDSARAALEARALDVATFFSPRASEAFVRLVTHAKLADSCRSITAIAISPAAAQPLAGLPFARTVAAERPTRQAVLDEIDRLPPPGVQSPTPMTDTPASPPPPEPIEPPVAPAAVPPAVSRARGLGIVGAFVIGLIAAVIVLAVALVSLPYWPQEARTLWRGPAVAQPAPPPPVAPPSAPIIDTAALDAAKRELTARLDDLDKRVRAAAATAAQADRPPADRPATPDPAIAELQRKLEALESKPAATEPDTSALKSEIVALRAGLQSLDQAVAGQKAAVDKAAAAANASTTGEQKALAAARGSAVIGIAARISAGLTAGQPFATDLGLLTPLAQGDAKLGALIATLQPVAAKGAASRASLAASFPAMAKAALADDLADDSFWQRLLGKLKNLVSLRRIGADVQGDSVEAKLARAEAAIDSGDLTKAVELVKSLPPLTSRATADWLARAEAHLAAQRAVDQLAAQAVTLLGSSR
ncbi:uroporphyrinogen-III synthase [Reyranella sp.]|uniref:uroporphyrinogen-III synthase n=1 Tax=Reyranella sp. TaxID=1929291 RepID=UPI003D0A7246